MTAMVVCVYVYIEVDGHVLGEPKFFLFAGVFFSGFYPQGVFIPLCNDCKRSHVDCVLNNISPQSHRATSNQWWHFRALATGLFEACSCPGVPLRRRKK